MLHQRLLGVLRGDSAESYGSNFNFQFLANHGFTFDPAGVKNRDLIVFGNHPIRNDQLCKCLDIAVLLVDHHPKFPSRTDCFFRRRKQSLMYSADQDIPVDALLAFPKL